jgi:hypothetical protein
MEPIEIIASDLFDKVRSRFKNLEMGDENGNVTIDPTQARFFDFDFMIEDSNFGRVSVNINDAGKLKLYYSQGITEDQEPDVKQLWYRFLKEMRLFSMRRLLRFDTRDISKSNLDKNDFKFLSTKKEKDKPPMEKMNESRWNGRNSKKTSRAVNGKTEVIIRHNSPVDEQILGSRSRRGNIKSIFIQNGEGERFKYPLNDARGAFAMAQHVNNGGVPHDKAGRAIIEMSEHIAQLQEFQKHVQHTTLNDDAIGIKERALGRLNDLKMKLESLSKRKNYEAWIAEFNETENDDMLITELDPVQFEDYKSKFTQQNFNEELGKFFPLIHNIMQEKIDLEEYVKLDDDSKNNESYSRAKSPDIQFEEWASSIEEGRLNTTELEKKLGDQTLEDKLSEISLGPDGMVALNELVELFDLDEADAETLGEKLKTRAETANQDDAGIDGPAMEEFKLWVEDTHPEWMEDLSELFSGEGKSTEEPPAEEPAPEPASEPVPAPAPAQPPQAPTVPTQQGVAEGYRIMPGIDRERYQERKGLEGPFTANNGKVVYYDPKEGKYYDPDTDMYISYDDWEAMNRQNMEESSNKDKDSKILEEIKSIVKRFYNAANEDVGPFRSQESVCLEVEKTLTEKYNEKVGQKAGLLAKKMMEKLTKNWEMKHQKSVDSLSPVDDEGLSRIQELAGLRKI